MNEQPLDYVVIPEDKQVAAYSTEWAVLGEGYLVVVPIRRGVVEAVRQCGADVRCLHAHGVPEAFAPFPYGLAEWPDYCYCCGGAVEEEGLCAKCQFRQQRARDTWQTQEDAANERAGGFQAGGAGYRYPLLGSDDG